MAERRLSPDEVARELCELEPAAAARPRGALRLPLALETDEQLDILATARDAVLEGKPHADFGAFVQGRLDAGLRGASLAQAIHLERLRRTPDSPTVVALAFADEPPAVSQLPDATHPRRAGQVRRYKGTWGRHP